MKYVGRDPDEAELFREAVRDATPLADRRRVPVPGPASGGRARRPSFDDVGEDPGRLHVEEGEGRAFGVSRKTLRELTRAGLTPQASLDLHRMGAEMARQRLARFLADSRATGLRAVLVITGKGRDDKGPAWPPQARLREIVPEWLAGPLSSGILAFAPARAEHGGAGALYVFLRLSSP